MHLALIVEEGNWINMEKEIWEGVMKDSMVAAAPRASMPKTVPSQTSRVEKPMASILPETPSVSEPEGVAPPQDMALVPRRQPPSPPGFSPQVPEDLAIPPLEDAYLQGGPILFDLFTLESLEMMISYSPVTGKVHYCLQAQSLARVTLLSTSTWRYLGPSPRNEEG